MRPMAAISEAARARASRSITKRSASAVARDTSSTMASPSVEKRCSSNP